MEVPPRSVRSLFASSGDVSLEKETLYGRIDRNDIMEHRYLVFARIMEREKMNSKDIIDKVTVLGEYETDCYTICTHLLQCEKLALEASEHALLQLF